MLCYDAVLAATARPRKYLSRRRVPMSLFPRLPPRCTHTVLVSEGHSLHVAEHGASDGVPIVYLHGGPGGGTPPDAPRLFDPERFRVVTFDQRGCGKSVCSDRLEGNSTDRLVADVEAIRDALGIERWAVMGSSYGFFGS